MIKFASVNSFYSLLNELSGIPLVFLTGFHNPVKLFYSKLGFGIT